MPGDYVFDSFAVLAFLQDEPGAARVAALLEGAADGEFEITMPVVNLGEAAYTMQNRHRSEIALTIARVDEWPLRIVNVDRELALVAARIKAERGLGYLDCFVVALAQRLDATVLTGDRDFEAVEDVVSVEWLPASA